MKYSLEKVIEAMELRQEKEDWDIRHDAIEYLKDYKDKEDHYAEAIKRTEDYRLMYLHAMANDIDNPELTWEDLKKMEGKAVWVEWIDRPWKGISKWVLIDRVSELMAIFTAIDACGVNYNGNLHNLSIGTQWNAYRKERE